MQTALPEGLVLRNAGDADLDGLARLRPPELDHRDRLRDARQPGFRYLVLEHQGEVIGFVCLVFARPASWPDARNAALLPQIVDAFIAPPLRSRGYGSALIRALEGLAWDQGFRAVFLSVDPIGNPRAQALYQRLGYRPLQQEPYREEGQYTDSAGQVHEGDDWELDMVRELHDVDVELEQVSFERKSVLYNLIELCQYDYSEFNGEGVNEHGLFGYRYLDHYWTEAGRYAYVVRAGGGLAGFALVRTLEEGDDGPAYSLAEFFILRKYRRRGIGGRAAGRVFDLFPGLWRVHLEAQNLPAQAFWRKVIGEYTSGAFAEMSKEGREGPTQEFRSPGTGGSA